MVAATKVAVGVEGENIEEMFSRYLGGAGRIWRQESRKYPGEFISFGPKS